MCWREAGLAARQMGDYEQAQTALELALDLYMDRAETVYAIHTLGNLATLYWYRGEFEKAMALSRQGLEQCEAAKLDPERRLPLGDLGAAAAHLDETGLAQQCLLESLEIARQIEDRTQEIFCLGHLGWLAIKLKEPAEAVERLQAGLALAESIRSCTEQSWLLSGLAEACHLSGEGQQARKCAQRALEQATATGQPYAERLARSILDKLDRG